MVAEIAHLCTLSTQTLSTLMRIAYISFVHLVRVSWQKLVLMIKILLKLIDRIWVVWLRRIHHRTLSELLEVDKDNSQKNLACRNPDINAIASLPSFWKNSGQVALEVSPQCCDRDLPEGYHQPQRQKLTIAVYAVLGAKLLKRWSFIGEAFDQELQRHFKPKFFVEHQNHKL